MAESCCFVHLEVVQTLANDQTLNVAGSRCKFL